MTSAGRDYSRDQGSDEEGGSQEVVKTKLLTLRAGVSVQEFKSRVCQMPTVGATDEPSS